ncbi:MAG: UDP-N-acetylmuramoyl-tripeptide--D-alanyl-D-alanine ligase [Candidatus Adlerbacteria bacterium]|nr:UDP-N-acetylmuramoyl-tripeptide--D-alanyl-D-alanine ligase [Candidatus Adlerbacteria bacterium]
MKSIFKKAIVALLTLESRAVLRKYHPKVVAVTGSVGKTATKDAVYQVLSTRAHTRKSEKSFNSELGVPLTIIGAPNAWYNPFGWARNLFDGLFLILFKTRYPEWLVLEVGADRPGDISSIAKWLTVDVAVITRLPEVPVHVEFFSSPEAVVEEKASLVGALKKDGALVLYGGDHEVQKLKDRAGERRVITFGLNAEADVRAEDVALLFEEGKDPPAGGWPLGMQAKLVTGGVAVPIEVVGAAGAHALLPALAAAAVGVVLDKKIEDITKALESYDPPPGRMHLVRGIKDTTIIDDTYNSSPAAVTAALDALKEVGTHAGTRKVAVLGDMLELGRHSAVEHKKVGAHAAEACDLLLTVGFRARDIAEGALDAGMPDKAILQYEDARRAVRELKNMLKQKDVVLVKGSQSIRMERVVEDIMLEPERAGELLVRQDPEWKKR